MVMEGDVLKRSVALRVRALGTSCGNELSMVVTINHCPDGTQLQSQSQSYQPATDYLT